MKEDQNIEYKESWRDDFLKWICGFANAQGGKIFIGIDDKGNVTGVTNAKKLLEDIPNKIVRTLGLVVAVNLHAKEGKDFIEIEVPVSDVPISYHGGYHYRSGSTKQELKGADLQRFILKKMGKSWDDIPIEKASEEEIDLDTVKMFKSLGTKNGRMAPEAESDSVHELLDNLQLLSEDNRLKSAAILSFGKGPKKYFTTAYIKIGRFGNSDHDLKFQDVINGNLLTMPGKLIEILKAKYLTSPITYEGIERKEQLEYPEDALREAILNAIVHKDYTGTFIQISVYDDRLVLWNPGTLPDNLGIEDLKKKHPSRPRNKNIAEVFFMAGFIEAWGRGISKIYDSLRLAGMPEPLFEETGGGIQVTFSKYFFNEEYIQQNNLNTRQVNALKYIHQNKTITNKKYQEITGTSRITATRDLTDLVAKKLIKSFGRGAGAFYSFE